VGTVAVAEAPAFVRQDLGTYYRLEHPDARVPILAWVKGVPFESEVQRQVLNLARMPCVFKQVVVLPDVHWGIGAAVGSVIATRGAIIPAAVGVDIGCGVRAVRTTLVAGQLPGDLKPLRSVIEAAVPHGRSQHGQRGDVGAWQGEVPREVAAVYQQELSADYEELCRKHPDVAHPRPLGQLGSLGTGNHFVEVCADDEDRIWITLHSGSRGAGNAIGRYFTHLARRQAHDFGYEAWLPDRDLAYLTESSPAFDDYLQALHWAQRYAVLNRRLMMERILEALPKTGLLPGYRIDDEIDCHHNYVAREEHFNREVWLTRKGAIRAGTEDRGLVPGSMGGPSFVVRGKGERESFMSCSHGAGRAMSRNKARATFTVEDHIRATAGVECRKDADVIDETPMAYKDVQAVMAAQADLAEIVHTLHPLICVKG